MRLPVVHCPNCNSLQRFAVKSQKVGDTIDSYVRCRTCRTKFDLGTMSVQEAQTLRRETVRRNRVVRRIR